MTAALAAALEGLEGDLEFQMLMLTGQAGDPGRARLFAAGSVPLLAADWKALTAMRWHPAHPESLPGRYAAFSIPNHTDRMLYLIFTAPGMLTVAMEAADPTKAADPDWTWSVTEITELPVNLAIWHALLPDGLWRAS